MTFDIITIFPDMFGPVMNESIMKRGQDKGKITIRIHDLRRYTKDKHRKVDDRPFGGGPGMVMMAQPIYDAVRKIRGRRKAKAILMTPAGRRLDQKMVKELAREKNLIILCGHYEGIDERVRELVADESVSIGDYVLTGGEIAAMVLLDSVARLVPGVVGKASSLTQESFEGDLLEYPHYTRPANFLGKKAPNVLLSGNHKEIEKWRKAVAVKRTRSLRPDLIKRKGRNRNNSL